ncbi:hypothetical protein J7T55_010041 [Diaporthe amygdali]|uniref:uncharacterized protein n=1 Tax=Phomopsis amygdali TaxID=1214568 RepID=UPI0022FEE0C9|nr:uncharacterized protein J7T55_010041 [Diaporthe amygdali]KAJ0116890.1 hypothetical protein J7T55_010041 [Diaporthe amygdali]
MFANAFTRSEQMTQTSSITFERNCSVAGSGRWDLVQKIKSNRTGWQNELAQSLLPYVLSHLSANILSNVHEALAVNQPVNWREFPPCDVRQNRSNPAFVLQAAGRAIQSRIIVHRDVLKRCIVMGAFLTIIKEHWLGCEWFREGYQGAFPEHKYLRHELFLEALNTYNEQPSQESFKLCADTLRWSLAALFCPIRRDHPAYHNYQLGTAAENLDDDIASEESKSSEGCDSGCEREQRPVCDCPGCITVASSSRSAVMMSQPS